MIQLLSKMFIDRLLDLIMYNCCDLRRFHIFIIFIIHRFQKMHLYNSLSDRVGVKRFERINQRNRYDRTLRLGRRLKTSAFKLSDFIYIYYTISCRSLCSKPCLINNIFYCIKYFFKSPMF